MNEEITPKPRRSKLAWTGWILWFTTVGGLYFLRHEATTKDAEIQKNQKELLSWFERADRTMTALDTNKVVAAISRQDEIIISLQARIQTDAEKLEEALKQQQNLNLRMSASLDAGEARAGEALKLADEAKAAGLSELALVYLANAIRSQPRDIRILEKYTGWVVEGRNPAIMEGAGNLLQEAIYGVAPKDVPAVTKLLGDVGSARETHDKVVVQSDVAENSLADSFEKLEKTPLRWDAESVDRADTQIEALSALLAQLEESDSDDPLLRKRMTQRLKVVQAFVLGHQILDLASMRFENLTTTEKLIADKASNENRTAALSALQATESAVNQIWSVPMSLVTPDLRDELVALPDKLKKEAEKIQDAVQTPDILIAETAWKNRPNQTDVKIQNRIIGCQAMIQECSITLGKVQGPNARKNAAKLYEQMSFELKDLQGKQFGRYQKWATTVIEATRQKYDNNYVSTNQHAFDAFYINQSAFLTIDQSLLSPEVSQFFQAVFSKLLGELDGSDQSRLQKELSFSGTTKMRMEDF